MSELLNEAGKLISEKAILPLLEELEKEASECLGVEVFVLDSGQKFGVFIRETEQGSSAKAEVRLLLKEGLSPNEFRFNGECITSEFSKETGFSGFSIKGKAFIENSTVEISGRTNRYNVWSWGSKFKD
ncbi:hypothetical protein RN22_01305 [Grimontia sp. AD028]|uniref:hypothetical protein n=1 Tax=Grimontia sp. AD028 TaxID=1581149 RepID=UPI00061B4674|nr:hypothetical protein [Grimontia sp. AD028]KKD62271.1 hypothetical protein RN22_01305 [Grimontia sp. AD028]